MALDYELWTFRTAEETHAVLTAHFMAPQETHTAGILSPLPPRPVYLPACALSHATLVSRIINLSCWESKLRASVCVSSEPLYLEAPQHDTATSVLWGT